MVIGFALIIEKSRDSIRTDPAYHRIIKSARAHRVLAAHRAGIAVLAAYFEDFVPLDIGIFLIAFLHTLFPSRVIGCVLVILVYHLLFGLSLAGFVVFIYIGTQAAVLLKVGTAYPRARGSSAPVAAYHADRHSKFSAKFICKIVAYRRPCTGIFRRGHIPAARIFSAYKLIVGHLALWRVVKAHILVRTFGKSLRTVFVVLQLKFHVGLSACEPYLADSNIRKNNAAALGTHLNGNAAVSLHRRQNGSPTAV